MEGQMKFSFHADEYLNILREGFGGRKWMKIFNQKGNVVQFWKIFILFSETPLRIAGAGTCYQSEIMTGLDEGMGGGNTDFQTL